MMPFSIVATEYSEECYLLASDAV